MFYKKALAFASLLNDSGHFGPVALYVEQELCSGERRHLQLTKASTLDGVVADVGSAMAVYSDVVDHPRLQTEAQLPDVGYAVDAVFNSMRSFIISSCRLA